MRRKREISEEERIRRLIIMGLIDIALSVAKLVVMVFDIVSYPVYVVAQKPWEKKKKFLQNTSRLVKKDTEEVSWKRDKGESPIYQEIIVEAGVDTVTKAFHYAVKKFSDKECLGTREVLGEEDEMQKNGKIFQKLALGDYKWKSYNQVYEETVKFGRGLRSLGINPGGRISIYAETREEWMISCLGAFSQNIHVSTVYTNLGYEAVIHALKETEVSLIVTSSELLPKFRDMLVDELPNVRHIIYFNSRSPGVKTDVHGFREDVDIISYDQLILQGAQRLDIKPNPPRPEDTAIIMYTSGSTGTPKGVELSHKNLVATMTCLMFMLSPKDDVYIAFLPLAHVLELLSENTMMLFGIKVGYSSPNTMTDMSTKVLKGTKGDASILKPTMMCAVPLIMDRIYKNIMDSVKNRGSAFEKVFRFCFEYKKYWIKSGFQTPIIDKIVFNKIRVLLGGRINYMLVGGAPLSPDVHDFIRTCLGCVLVQGYSLTEITSSGTVMNNDDMSVGTVGLPMTNMYIKLVNWRGGSYSVTDRPNPRGEILISGDSVAKGYFKLPEKTKEAFFVGEDGRRWFRTGDIGEFDSTGKLKLIDRKKDLVKLQLGEYVSLGKIESLLKTHPLVENICVYGDPYRKTTVALLCPSKARIEQLAHSSLGKTESSFEDLCDDDDVITAVLKALIKHAKAVKLEKFEIPMALTLCPEIWTPESGLITAAFKLKRKVLQMHYQNSINRMYTKLQA